MVANLRKMSFIPFRKYFNPIKRVIHFQGVKALIFRNVCSFRCLYLYLKCAPRKDPIPRVIANKCCPILLNMEEKRLVAIYQNQKNKAKMDFFSTQLKERFGFLLKR